MATKAKWKKGRLTFYNGAVDDQSITVTTAASTAITNYGVSVLKSAAASVFAMDPPALGCQKHIVFQSTLVLKLKAAGATIVSNTTIDDVLSAGVTATMKDRGLCCKLIGASTAAWYLANGSSMITLTSST